MSAGKCFPAWRVVKNWGASDSLSIGLGELLPQGRGAPQSKHALAGMLFRETLNAPKEPSHLSQ